MRGRDFFRRKAGRRDANHAAIRDGLRKLGHFVVDLAGVGDGVPDLCVFRLRQTQPVFLELKTSTGALLESQERWQNRAIRRGLIVRTVRTLDEALAVLG